MLNARMHIWTVNDKHYVSDPISIGVSSLADAQDVIAENVATLTVINIEIDGVRNDFVSRNIVNFYVEEA